MNCVSPPSGVWGIANSLRFELVFDPNTDNPVDVISNLIVGTTYVDSTRVAVALFPSANPSAMSVYLQILPPMDNSSASSSQVLDDFEIDVFNGTYDGTILSQIVSPLNRDDDQMLILCDTGRWTAVDHCSDPVTNTFLPWMAGLLVGMLLLIVAICLYSCCCIGDGNWLALERSTSMERRSVKRKAGSEHSASTIPMLPHSSGDRDNISSPSETIEEEEEERYVV